jgi:7-cyano-7-deazaguanine reductase
MELSDTQKSLLSNIGKPETVDKNVLEVMKYAYGGQRDIEITIKQPEFTSLCPLSGLPDFGSITICYVPKDRIVELKSLKYYLLQFRNVGVFYEHVVNHILDDLVHALDPKSLQVVGTFTPRGGITTTVRATHGKQTASG